MEAYVRIDYIYILQTEERNFSLSHTISPTENFYKKNINFLEHTHTHICTQAHYQQELCDKENRLPCVEFVLENKRKTSNSINVAKHIDKATFIYFHLCKNVGTTGLVRIHYLYNAQNCVCALIVNYIYKYKQNIYAIQKECY